MVERSTRYPQRWIWQVLGDLIGLVPDEDGDHRDVGDRQPKGRVVILTLGGRREWYSTCVGP